MKELKIGLIGCGFMGSMHANCYHILPNVKVCAVADLRREKAEALAALSGAKIHETGMELIEKEALDIIDICLPTYLHAEHALAAMDKVKYLFIEKPVALTAEEGDALLKKSAETGCQVQVGQVIRFWDEYVELKKYVDENRFGAVVNAVFRRISPRPDWGWQDWLLDAKRSGGAAQDLHVHDIDFVLSLFGEPEKFYSVRNQLSETNSFVSTLMQYKTFPVHVEGTWDLPGCYPFSASFRVVFEKATVEYAGGKLVIYDNDGLHEVKIEKPELPDGCAGGNISDLGGYFNELLSFTTQAQAGEAVQRATLPAAVASLNFLRKELSF